MHKHKQLLLAAAVIIAASLLTMPLAHEVDAQSKKKPVRPEKCNNIRIQVNVNGVEENQTYTATVNLGTGTKVKSGTVEANETSITLPVAFKKISPCPVIGFEFTGDVNGTEFTGQIKSVKKPNKVTVDL